MKLRSFTPVTFLREKLIVMSPKSLLRHPLVVSPVTALNSGAFKEILDDPLSKPKSVRRVLCCSGKVYYDLLAKQDSQTAIVRFEQLYPLAIKQIKKLCSRYSNAEEWVWVQEESENMGAWTHILRHYSFIKWVYVGRPASASPAVGSSKVHQKQQEELVELAFKKLKGVHCEQKHYCSSSR